MPETWGRLSSRSITGSRGRADNDDRRPAPRLRWEEAMSRSRHCAGPLALGIGALLLAAPALAAPAAPSPGRDRPLRVEGALERPDQALWYTAALEKGKDYTISSGTGSYYRAGPAVALYEPSGKRLLSFVGGSLSDETGLEFRAPSAGTYKVAASKSPDGGGVYVGFGIGIALDCPRGPTTTCKLAVGQRSRGDFAFVGDQDWRRIAVQAGRHYSLLLWGHGESAVDAVVLDRHGKAVASCSAGDQAQQPCLDFTATYSGPYYVNVSTPDYEEPSYDIGLTSR